MPQKTEQEWGRRKFIKTAGLGALSLLVPGGLIEAQASAETEPKRRFEIVVTKNLRTPVYSQWKGEYRRIIVEPKDEMEPGATFQVELQGNGWYRIHPDNYEGYAWLKYNVTNVYLREEDCRIVPECSPLTLLPGTKPEDKQILILYNGYLPYALFLEGEQVIAKVPVAIGGSPAHPRTPPADHRINVARVSRYMPPHHGVPFVMYYSATDGRAAHGSPWRYKFWDEFAATHAKGGTWGSAGCINLPCLTPNTIFNVMEDTHAVGFDNFAFRWALTNLGMDPYNDDKIEVLSTDPGWRTGQTSLRTVVAREPEAMARSYPPSPSKTSQLQSWEPILTQIQTLEGHWLVPKLSQGQTSLIHFT